MILCCSSHISASGPGGANKDGQKESFPRKKLSTCFDHADRQRGQVNHAPVQLSPASCGWSDSAWVKRLQKVSLDNIFNNIQQELNPVGYCPAHAATVSLETHFNMLNNEANDAM